MTDRKADDEDLSMHDILQRAQARDLKKDKDPATLTDVLQNLDKKIQDSVRDVNMAVPDAYGIPAAPSENTDVISDRMLAYGENIAKAFDDLAEATRADADDFISQCKQNAELARQIARDRAAEAVKYASRMRRLSTILKEE